MSKIDLSNDEFRLLKKVVESDSFHFIIVQYNHLDIVRQLKDVLSESHKYLDIEIKEKDNGDFIKKISDFKEDVVFLERFENLFVTDNQNVALGFNQRRDKISQNSIKVIIFLPIGLKYLKLFKEKLPDIASITSMYFDFRLDIIPDEKILEFTNPILETSYTNVPEALKEKDRLQQRISDLENDKKNKNRLIDLKIDLAEVEKFLSNFENAEKILKSLLIPSTISALDTMQLITIENNLAMVLKDLGKYEESKIIMKKIIESNEKNYGSEHPITSISYSNLATVLQDTGEYDEAKVLMEKVLKSNEITYGLEHPKTSISYSNLALLLRDLGNFDKAKMLLEVTVKSNEKNFGFEHPNTAISYSNLALVLQNLGEYEKAKSLFTKALMSNEKNLGIDHPNTAITNSNLAILLIDMGDYKRAKILLERALKSNEKKFGPSHPITAINYSNLATVLTDLKDFNKAKKLLEKALIIYKKSFGENHHQTQVIANNLINVTKKMKE